MEVYFFMKDGHVVRNPSGMPVYMIGQRINAVEYAEKFGYRLRELLLTDLIATHEIAVETVRYLQSDKFNSDTTVQVDDVIRRLKGY